MALEASALADRRRAPYIARRRRSHLALCRCAETSTASSKTCWSCLGLEETAQTQTICSWETMWIEATTQVGAQGLAVGHNALCVQPKAARSSTLELAATQGKLQQLGA